MSWGVPRRPKISSKLSHPNPREGSDGDMQILNTGYGAKLFGKLSGRWYSTPLFDGNELFSIKDKNGVAKIRINPDKGHTIQLMAGNVGIGTDVPATLLEISGGDLTIAKPDNDSETALYFKNLYSKTAILADGDTYWGASDLRFCLDNTGDTSVVTTADTQMIITREGTVGIGATTVDEHLHIEGAGAQFLKIETTDNNLAGIMLMSYTGGGASYATNKIYTVYTGGSQGNFYITQPDGGGGTAALTINHAGTFAGSSSADISDERLKENIKDSSVDGLSIINSLTLREFNWKKKYNKKESIWHQHLK